MLGRNQIYSRVNTCIAKVDPYLLFCIAERSQNREDADTAPSFAL